MHVGVDLFITAHIALSAECECDSSHTVELVFQQL